MRLVKHDHPLGNRICLVGDGGKSSLARAIGAKKRLPAIELDAIHWLPGWQERPRDESARIVRTTTRVIARRLDMRRKLLQQYGRTLSGAGRHGCLGQNAVARSVVANRPAVHQTRHRQTPYLRRQLRTVVQNVSGRTRCGFGISKTPPWNADGVRIWPNW